jgi:membrane protein DedA with SNARE-associated domain
VGVIALVAACEYLFPVIPGRVLLLVAAGSVARGDCGAVRAFWLLTTATVFSASVQYVLGKRLRERFEELPGEKTLGLRHAQVLDVAGRLRKRAYVWMVLGELIPFVRSVRFGSAAVAGLRFWPALLSGLSPVVVRNVLVLWVAASAAGDEARVKRLFEQGRWYIGGLGLLALGVLVWPLLAERRKARAGASGA